MNPRPVRPLLKVIDRNRALTQDLQRERAERQRMQARLVAAERDAEGDEAENLSETMGALEVKPGFRADLSEEVGCSRS